jgi:hypothetical protein
MPEYQMGMNKSQQARVTVRGLVGLCYMKS